VDRPGELAQPPPRASRGHRLGRHRRAVAGRGTLRRRAAPGQGGGHVEHRLVLFRVREVARGRQRLVHTPRMPGRPVPGPPGPVATPTSGRGKVAALKQPVGEFVGELAADDQDVDEVKRLKDNVRLVRLDRYNHDSRTSFLQISV
jgi:hypothetical protein